MDCGIPFCHTGLPAGQPDPGVERPGLARRLGRGAGAAARHQQLPGVHRAAVPGSVRDGLRGGDQPRSGDDQERRGRDHRQGVGRAPGQAAGPRLADRQDRRRDRLRPGRPGRRAAADPGRSHGRRLRARRRAGRPDALRHPRVQDGEGGPRPPDPADAGRGHQLPLRRRGRQVDVTGAPAARSATTRSCWPSARPSAATCRCPGRELDGIHQAMEFLPQANRVARGRGRRGPDHRRRASTW